MIFTQTHKQVVTLVTLSPIIYYMENITSTIYNETPDIINILRAKNEPQDNISPEILTISSLSPMYSMNNIIFERPDDINILRAENNLLKKELDVKEKKIQSLESTLKRMIKLDRELNNHKKRK